MKNKKYLAIIIACMLVVTLSVSFFVMAATRTATISSSRDHVPVGETVTVTLGYTKGATRQIGFTVSYDSSLLEFVSKRNISGLSGDFKHRITGNQINVGVANSGTQTVNIGSAISLTFKVKATGTATLKIIDALDGIIDPEENTIIPGASVTITLVQAATTTPTTKKTTTTTATQKTTTKTTTTKPTKTKTKTTNTPPSTNTTTPAETTTTTTAPTGPVVPFSATRYDGVVLGVPESVPSEESIPESFAPVEIEGYDTEITGYRSATMPYTLFWLADDGGEARFYYLDEETSRYVPFLRSEWSSRFFTFSVVSEGRLPEGFELTTIDVRGQKVPAYTPMKGFYMTRQAYYDLMSKIGPDTVIPDWRQYEGETTPTTSNDAVETSITTETTTTSGGDNPLTWQGVPVEIPEEIFLVALRMNDSKDKTLYFYDKTLDSIIRADLWLVPLAGTVLEYGGPTEPVTEPTTIPATPTTTTTSQVEPVVDGARSVELFGFTVPMWLLIACGALLLLLLLLLIRGIKRAREARESVLDFHLDDDSYDGGLENVEQVDPLYFDEASKYGDVKSDEGSLKQSGAVSPMNQQTGGKEFLHGEGSADEVEVPARDSVQPTDTVEDEWVKLQRAVELSSARRHRQKTESALSLEESESDEEETAMQEGVCADTDTRAEMTEEPEKTVIEPGMRETRPMRRVSLRRLEGDVNVESDAELHDEDEL